MIGITADGIEFEIRPGEPQTVTFKEVRAHRDDLPDDITIGELDRWLRPMMDGNFLYVGFEDYDRVWVVHAEWR